MLYNKIQQTLVDVIAFTVLVGILVYALITVVDFIASVLGGVL